MKRILKDERGMALAVAIFALVVVGALVAGAFFAGTQEQRVGENSRRVQQSFGIADAGVAEVVRGWDPSTINQRGTYPTDSVRVSQVASPAGSGQYGGYVYKLNPNLFLVDVNGVDNASLTGNIRGGGARQRIGLITRVRPLQIDIGASLTTQGTVEIKGTSEVDGNDQNPAGWNCDPTDTNKAGVRNTGTVTVSGSGSLYGNPPAWNDPSVNDSTFTQFGDLDYNALAAQANLTLVAGGYKTYPQFTGTGACDKNSSTNWGDGVNKASACANYFPIIHITGSAVLNGDQGQGILLVDGDLTVNGSYEWFGIVIVLGNLQTQGGGATQAHFWGGVMAKSATIETTSIAGKATLNYSKCAILQALQNTQTTSSLRSRGWVQLF